MALSATIYKIDLNIADMDKHNYSAHNLTLAKHPSETEERLMVRLLAFTFFANDALTFGKGLSEDDEPDLIQKDLTDAITLWIDVGLPTEKEIRKACGKSKQVAIFIYGGNVADIWWKNNGKGLAKLKNLTVINLPNTMQLVDLCSRNMEISCNTQDGQLMISSNAGSLEVMPDILKSIG